MWVVEYLLIGVGFLALLGMYLGLGLLLLAAVLGTICDIWTGRDGG